MNKNPKSFLSKALAVALTVLMLVAASVLVVGAAETVNVAKIGDTEYATLAAAMTEANKAAGDYTITLLKDSAEVFTFAQKKGVNITIDGDGNTFSGKITLNAGGGNLTFTDAKIAPANSQTIYLNASTAPNVTFDGCTLQGANKSGTIVYGYASSTSNSVTVKNCTADNLQYIISFRQTGSNSVLIEKVTATNMIYLARTLKCPSVTVKNVTCDAVIGIDIKNDAAGGKLTLENVNINIVTHNGSLYAPISGSGAGQSWNVELNGVNTFSANGVAYEDTTWFSGNSGYANNVEAQNGSKFGDLAAIAEDAESGDTVTLLKDYTGDAITLPEGVQLDTNGKADNDKITVVLPTYVAQIGEQGYETLADAIAAAKDGDTIKFLANIEENVTINKKLTIDGARFTYTGKMTLEADTTIKNVNFDGKGYNGYAVVTDANYVTIEDCTAKNYGYGFVNVYSDNVHTTLRNVTISGVNYGVKVDYSYGVTLENVNITAGVAAVLNSNYGEKTITIKNSKLNILGTWTRNNTTKTNYVFEGDNTVGEFKTDAAIDNFKLALGATLTAPEGLTVTTDVEGYGVEYKEGKYITVKQVAEVNGVKYATLAEAIANATAGDTIKFLADITENVTISKNITIVGADFTFTGKITINNNVEITIEDVNFVKGYIVYNNGNAAYGKLVVNNCSFVNGGYAIETAKVQSVTIEGCTVVGQSLLYARLTTSYIYVKDTTIDSGNYLAHLVYGTEATFENVTATNMPYYGISTQNYGPKTINLINCNFDAQWPLATRDDRTDAYDTFVFQGENVMPNLELDGHMYFKLASGATLTAPEGVKVTTDLAGYIVNYKDGKYQAVTNFVVTHENMRFGNTLSLLFAVPKYEEFGEGCYVVITHTYLNEENKLITATETIQFNKWDGNILPGYYVVEYDGLAAKQMTDAVTVTFYDANGALGATFTSSIRMYAESVLSDATLSTFHPVVVNMLNYGAAAQVYFGYNTTELANAGLTDAQEALATPTFAVTNELLAVRHAQGVSREFFKASGVRFNDSINLIFQFQGMSEELAANLIVTFKDEEGNPISECTELAWVKEDGAWAVEFDALDIADAYKVIICEVENKNTGATLTIRDSVAAYIARRLDTIEAQTSNKEEAAANLYTAFMNFADSAKAYRNVDCYKTVD